MNNEAIISPEITGNWIDHLPEAALLVDAARDLILSANSAMGRMIGTDRQSLTGTPCTHLFTDQRPQLIAFTEETLFRSHGWSRDFFLQHRDGHTVELEISSSWVGEAESQNILLLLDATSGWLKLTCAYNKIAKNTVRCLLERIAKGHNNHVLLSW